MKFTISLKVNGIYLASCFAKASVFRKVNFLNEDHFGGGYPGKIRVKMNFSVQTALTISLFLP